MCGFAGHLSGSPGTADDLRASAERMIAPITHRGPDDSGTWADATAGVALGFRRLAIIDLSEKGHQPMRSSSGRFVMVFNRRGVQLEELRRELEGSGARFSGHSDSEVMLAAFEQWGGSALFRGSSACSRWRSGMRGNAACT